MSSVTTSVAFCAWQLTEGWYISNLMMLSIRCAVTDFCFFFFSPVSVLVLSSPAEATTEEDQSRVDQPGNHAA